MTRPASNPDAWKKPLKKLCAVCAVRFEPELGDAWWDVLGHVPAAQFDEAVKRFISRPLKEGERLWMPAPGELLRLVEVIEGEKLTTLCAAAPPCEACGVAGLVTARVKPDGPWMSYACLCIRGKQYPKHGPFNPKTMETWRGNGRRLMSESGQQQKRIAAEELVDSIAPSIPSRRKTTRRT